MKRYRICIFMACAMSLAPMAHASDDDNGHAVLGAGEAYNTIKAMVDYCSRVDERHEDTYARLGAATLKSVAGKGNVSDDASVYARVSATLSQLTRSAGIKDCTAAIGVSPNEVERHPKR
jgi:hypothetical protein